MIFPDRRLTLIQILSSTGVFLLLLILGFEWKEQQGESEKSFQESSSKIPQELKIPSEKKDLQKLIPHNSLNSSKDLTIQCPPSSMDLSDKTPIDSHHAVIFPSKPPAMYANPEVLGEVPLIQEQMYNRVMDDFVKTVGRITASPDSPEYREAFQKACEVSENRLRAVLGQDAFLRLKLAVQKGQTIQ